MGVTFEVLGLDDLEEEADFPTWAGRWDGKQGCISYLGLSQTKQLC